MNFVTYAQLVKDVVAWSEQLPRDIDVVAGIPRSGMLPATILALHRNIRLTDIHHLDSLHGGQRDRHRGSSNIFVVDDSCLSGASLHQSYEIAGNTVRYGAVYVKPGRSFPGWYFYKKLDTPRVFEWNLFHHSIMKESCLDIDGVICQEGKMDEDYSIRLPKNIPTVRVKALVTARLKKYKKTTEEWLEKHGIEYDRLYMLDLPDWATRRRLKPHAKFKAEVYRKLGAKLFVESSAWQSQDIAKYSKKPVICIDEMRLYDGRND